MRQLNCLQLGSRHCYGNTNRTNQLCCVPSSQSIVTAEIHVLCVSQTGAHTRGYSLYGGLLSTNVGLWPSFDVFFVVLLPKSTFVRDSASVELASESVNGSSLYVNKILNKKPLNFIIHAFAQTPRRRWIFTESGFSTRPADVINRDIFLQSVQELGFCRVKFPRFQLKMGVAVNIVLALLYVGGNTNKTKQVALLSQRGRAMLRVCQQLASIVQNVEQSHLLLVT